MRWGEETSFRELKYAIGLNALHAKKRELIQQEIYARMLMYNFCQRIVQEIKIPKKDRSNIHIRLISQDLYISSESF